MGKTSRNKNRGHKGRKHTQNIPSYFRKDSENAQTIEEAILDSTPSVEHTHSQTIRDFDKEHSHPIKRHRSGHTERQFPIRSQDKKQQRNEMFGQILKGMTDPEEGYSFSFTTSGDPDADYQSHQPMFGFLSNNMINDLTQNYINFYRDGKVRRVEPWHAQGEKNLATASLIEIRRDAELSEKDVKRLSETGMDLCFSQDTGHHQVSPVREKSLFNVGFEQPEMDFQKPIFIGGIPNQEDWKRERQAYIDRYYDKEGNLTKEEDEQIDKDLANKDFRSYNRHRHGIIGLRDSLVHGIKDSRTYLWRQNVLDTALAMPLPKHTITKNLMPFPTIFMVFENPLELPFYSQEWIDANNGGEPELKKGLTDWILLAHIDPPEVEDFQSEDKRERNKKDMGRGDGYLLIDESGKKIRNGGLLAVWNIRGSETGHDEEIFALANIPYGAIYPNQFTGNELVFRPIVRELLAMLNFLNTPMIEKVQEGLPRRMRREFERKVKKGKSIPTVDPTTVIYLRKSYVNSDNSDKETSSRNYQSRWWVTGHYRSQWYGSTKEHRLKWIPPYIKGPDGLPIKVKTYMVVR